MTDVHSKKAQRQAIFRLSNMAKKWKTFNKVSRKPTLKKQLSPLYRWVENFKRSQADVADLQKKFQVSLDLNCFHEESKLYWIKTHLSLLARLEADLHIMFQNRQFTTVCKWWVSWSLLFAGHGTLISHHWGVRS